MDNGKDNVKVSVIIPTYNRASEIGKAVRSVINQTLKEIEVIVVDDNPPESQARKDTRAVIDQLKKADSRLIYIEHPRNLNGSVARNSGLKVAKGEVIAFLDDDDCYLPEKLEKQFELLMSLENDYGGIVSNCIILRDGKIVKVLDVSSEENAIVTVLACVYNMGSGSNLFVKKSVVDEIGGFDERLLRHQDYDFLVRFFQKYKMKKIYEPLFQIEQRSSHLNTPNLKKLEDAKAVYLSKYEDIIASLPNEDMNYVYYNQYISLCETAIRAKDREAAKNYHQLASKYFKVGFKQRVRMSLLKLYVSLPNRVKKRIKLAK